MGKGGTAAPQPAELRLGKHIACHTRDPGTPALLVVALSALRLLSGQPKPLPGQTLQESLRARASLAV